VSIWGASVRRIAEDVESTSNARGAVMTQTAHRTRLTQVATVFVPVADQERALEFYVHKLGFEKRGDFHYGDGGRWIEVAPPGSAIAIALVPPSEGRSSGSGEACCALVTEDIEADHATLRVRGVDVDPEIAGAGKRRPGLISVEVSVADPVPRQFLFRDVDGNRFLIVQPA
jgi:catechol 2,3-dioxygenase-like lactoylglutathione lyase family enzyme